MPTPTRRPPTVRLFKACSNVDPSPDGVERDVQVAASGGLGDLGGQLGVAGVERIVGADGERSVENGRLDVDRDDRRGADEPGQLHHVSAEAADAPHPDGLADADLGRPHHGAVRGGDRVGQDGGLLQGTLSGILVSPNACATVYSAHAPS